MITLQKYPNIQPTSASSEFNRLLESRGYVWAPLVEPHTGYAGPEADMECEVVEVGVDRTLVLAYATPTSSWLLGYLGSSDVPTIFEPNESAVELALKWVGAL